MRTRIAYFIEIAVFFEDSMWSKREHISHAIVAGYLSECLIVLYSLTSCFTKLIFVYRTVGGVVHILTTIIFSSIIFFRHRYN